jgi:hypothetical protein
LRYGLGALGLWLLTIYLFTIVAPWTAAMAPEQVPEAKRVEGLNSKWDAVVDQHGELREWSRGTVAQSSAAFTAHLLAMLLCGTAAVVLARRSNQKGATPKVSVGIS